MSTEPNGRVYLAWNRLINCQSHEDTLLQFNSGLTSIVAPNGTGKSVFFKMIYATVYPQGYNRDELKSLISWDAESAISMYGFSDEYEGGVSINTKAQLVYYYRENQQAKYKTSVVCPYELKSRLNILVDEKTDFFANIIDQDQSLLFVKKSSTANNLIKMVISDDSMDTLIQRLGENLDVYIKEEKRLREITYGAELILSRSEHTNMTELYQSRELFSNLLEIFADFVEGVDLLDSMIPTSSGGMSVDNLIVVLDFYEFMEDSVPLLQVAEEFPEELELIEGFLEMSASIESSLFPEGELTGEILDALDIFLEMGEDVSNLVPVNLEEVDSRAAVSELFLSFLEIGSDIEIFSASCKEYVEYGIIIAGQQEEFDRLGRFVDGCPIYGAVRHIGDICIPVGD